MGLRARGGSFWRKNSTRGQDNRPHQAGEHHIREPCTAQNAQLTAAAANYDRTLPPDPEPLRPRQEARRGRTQTHTYTQTNEHTHTRTNT